MENPMYLGDGVYVQKTLEYVILTTGSHSLNEAGDVVYLEPEVLQTFMD